MTDPRETPKPERDGQKPESQAARRRLIAAGLGLAVVLFAAGVLMGGLITRGREVTPSALLPGEIQPTNIPTSISPPAEIPTSMPPTQVAYVPPTITPNELPPTDTATNTSTPDHTVQAAYAALTAVPVTLTAGAQAAAASNQQIRGNEAQIESLRLAAEAVKVLNDPQGNPETAALLGIRALRTAYSQQADTALAQALTHLYTERVFPGFMAAAFSPDGRYLLTDVSGTAVLYDAVSGERVRSFSGHTDPLGTLAFSADGRLVFTASWDHTARIWDTATGETLRTLSLSREQALTDVDFSADGHYVLTADGDTAQLWDATTGQLLHSLERHNGMMTGAFSPDGQTFITAGLGQDNLMRFWDVATGTLQRSFAIPSELIFTVNFSPDGRFILTGGRNTATSLWDAATGDLVRTFTEPVGDVEVAIFSPNGQFVLTTRQTSAQLWDTATGALVRTFAGHTLQVNGAAFSPDGQHLLTASSDGSARLWAVNAEPLARTAFRDPGGVLAIFSPDGRSLLYADGDLTLRMRDAVTGEVVRTFAGHRGTIFSLAFSADGQSILSMALDNTARLWDVATGNLLRIFKPDAQLSSAELSVDGRYVVTGNYNHTATLWDTASGQALRQFVGHTDAVLTVAISPDSRFILTGSRDRGAQLWDAATGASLLKLIGHTDALTDVGFSPDGRVLVTASDDHTARLWDAATGSLIRTFSQHGDTVLSVTFSPDGRILLTSSLDKFVRLWDVQTGALVRTLPGYLIYASPAVFSPDGRLVLGWQYGDHTLQVWDTDPRDFINYACARVFRDFAPGTAYTYPNERDLYQITDTQPTCSPGGSGVNASDLPFPPTSTGAPTATIPVWTPIVSPTPSNTVTLTPSRTPSPLPAPTGTPSSVFVAQVGENRGEIPPGGGQVWTYTREADERVTITLKADHPANTARDRTGLLDAFMVIYAPDGTVFTEVDDINPGIITDARIENLWFPVAGEFRIEVRGLGDETSGAYTLVIESNRV